MHNCISSVVDTNCLKNVSCAKLLDFKYVCNLYYISDLFHAKTNLVLNRHFGLYSTPISRQIFPDFKWIGLNFFFVEPNRYLFSPLGS